MVVHLVVVADVVTSSMPIASGLDIYSPLTVLDCFCHTCFWSGFDFEDVKLSFVVTNHWILISTVVIVYDFYQKVVSKLFGLSVVVVVGGLITIGGGGCVKRCTVW